MLCKCCQSKTKNKKYCSLSCANKSRVYTKKNPKINKCQFCQSETTNPKFCSSSCAAKLNNVISPKRTVEPQNLCKNCNARLSRTTGRRDTNLCQSCFLNNKRENDCIEYGKLTKRESVKMAELYRANHKYELIRRHGKRCAKYYGWESPSCEKCGYSYHTQLCHIKPISKFQDSSLLSEINSRENICFLCPNCHWELDHPKS